MSATGPTVSVVVVSDYGGGPKGEWDYLRRALEAVHAQSVDGEIEIVLVDATPSGEAMPADVVEIAPRLRVLRDPAQRGSDLVNRAAHESSADLVALLDGDCVPDPGWLGAAVEAMRRAPEAAVVSGLTVYPGESFTSRVLGTLLRSFVDPGGPGRTRFMTSNNAVFRRDVLLDHPVPRVEPRHLALRLQTESIRAAGGELHFEPGMRAVHRFGGWSNERRIRRRVGYRAVRLRQLDPRAPHAWLVRFGASSIPIIVAARTWQSWQDCIRSGRHFGLRWFELPAAFAVAVAVHLLEIGGMLAAFADGRAPAAAAKARG